MGIKVWHKKNWHVWCANELTKNKPAKALLRSTSCSLHSISLLDRLLLTSWLCTWSAYSLTASSALHRSRIISQHINQHSQNWVWKQLDNQTHRQTYHTYVKVRFAHSSTTVQTVCSLDCYTDPAQSRVLNYPFLSNKSSHHHLLCKLYSATWNWTQCRNLCSLIVDEERASRSGSLCARTMSP